MSNLLKDVAIIGAGTAGALAANQLNASGLDCCVIEKSRGFGGRCSRRSLSDSSSINIGAASFIMSNDEHPSLKANLNRWLNFGYLNLWRFSASDFQAHQTPEQKVELYGSPTMNAFHRHLLQEIQCLNQQHVKKLIRTNDRWQLLGSSGQIIVESKAVIITAPAEQTYNLVGTFDLEHNAVLCAAQASLPQYICAISFDQPQTQLADVYSGQHAVFSKVIRANSQHKNDNNSPAQNNEIWVLHSTHSWAQQQQHKDPQHVAKEMASLFCEHFNITATNYALSQAHPSQAAKVLTSHYWRLADHDHEAIKNSFDINRTEDTSFLWNQDLKLGCSADWLAGGGILGALRSSQYLCNHITSQLKQEV